jgi:hypothetical protein
MRLRTGIVGLALLVAGCHPATRTPGDGVPRRTFTGQKVRSFTDTFAVTSIADSPTHLWVGTAHGLLRWDVAAGKYSVLTTKDGLPADKITAVAVDGQGGVWVATPKGLARANKSGWQSVSAPPVGDFLTGLQPTADGRALWAGGPEGLARLHGGKWERYLRDVGVTALVAAPNGAVWVGTSGRGVLRITKSNDHIEAWGTAQGCEVDVVRGLAASDHGVLVVGDGPGGPRAAWFDGERFYSYAVDSPQVLEWAARSGAKMLIGAGENAWELQPMDIPADAPDPAPEGPVKLKPTQPATLRAVRGVALKPDMPSSALEEPATGKFLPSQRAPHFDTAAAGFHMPDGVTAVGPSERGLLVGTRFLGAQRIENGVVRSFRMSDLSAGAERIAVACKTNQECYLATGGTKAWRFDGAVFDVAAVDPEPGSRVLAVLRDPKGAVLAIHRGNGKGASNLRMSTVDDGRWMPVAMQDVAVPNGPPLLNFAAFSPDGRLWVGLRYQEKTGEGDDYGAAEIEVDSGQVVYHRESNLDEKTTFGVALPTNMVAMYWRSAHEAWFATRSGAARMLDGKVKVFTPNEGLESDLVNDIDSGPHDEVWVATDRGTGRYDGTHWVFPRLGAFYMKASSLAHDKDDHHFIGTEKGLFCVGDCDPDGIDTKRGLLDDSVLDLTVDPRGRVWVLTGKGISIVEP